MIDTPKVLQTKAQDAAVIHITVPRADIQKVMGPGIAELRQTLEAPGITPAGPWFTHHWKMDPAVFDYEIGLPIDKPVAPKGRVTPGKVPALRAARTIYHGPYEGLGTAWMELDAWIKAQGQKAAAGLWETYLVDPSSNPDPASWRTELTRPLEG